MNLQCHRRKKALNESKTFQNSYREELRNALVVNRYLTFK